MSEFESSNPSAAGLRSGAARSTGRRAFVKGVAAAVTAVGAGVMLPHAAAATGRGKQQAAPLFPFPPPPVGVEIPCSMYAANASLRLHSPNAVTLDFKGGISYRATSADENRADFDVPGFRVEADLSPNTPNSGTVIVITSSPEATATLSMGASGEAEMVTRLPATVSTIDKASGQETVMAVEDPAQPFVLVSRNVQAFPPVNQWHELQHPVRLLDLSGNPAGSLDVFAALMNQSG
jgi:hypothetical protein